MGDARFDTQVWRVGAATITSVVEDETVGIPPEFFFPEATAPRVAAHDWVVPDWADADGNISLRVQALVVECGGVTTVVDPCVGNGKVRSLFFWNEQSYPFLERFDAAGFDPAQVDQVLHTHLHADHVGWDTQLLDGTWVPTFTGARHLYTQAELDSLRERPDPAEDVYGDSVGPIFDAGLADIVDVDADLGGGLRLEWTPGHTPGHVSLWIESDREQAFVTGDFMHHPVQFAEPGWAEIGDADVDGARATRRRLIESLAGRDVLVIGTHFGLRPAGHVVVDGDAWRFRPVS